MAKNLNLRLEIINQVIEDLASERIQSPLPSQTNLATLYNVSRTTIRYVIEHLIEIGVIANQNNELVILRLPNNQEKQFYLQTKKINDKNLLKLEQYLQSAVQKKLIKPGDELSELELAKSAKVDVQTIREYFMQFSRFHLVENVSRGKWKLIKFDQHYADKLIELREILECHALECFMKLPQTDIRWSEMKMLQKQHIELRKSIVEHYSDFAILDYKFHSLLLSAADNPFINDFIDLISVIFHFHYQWDNRNLRTRNILALEEHLAIFHKILNQDKQGAIQELQAHLQTAKKTLMDGIK